MRQYALNLLIALDQFANVLLGGAPDRTISYRVYDHKDHWAGAAAVKLIDWIFRLFGEKDHCRTVWESGDNQVDGVWQ